MPLDYATSRPASKAALWTGIVLSTLPALLLLFSAVMKLMRPPAVIEGFRKFGFPDGVAFGIGVVELACTILYLFPRTAVLGAILLTGYLGGATVTHLRASEPYFAPPLIGVVLWLGLYLRDGRLRALVPWRS